jgi:hypothetical protein
MNRGNPDMITTAPEPTAELQPIPIGEQRVVIRGVTWDAYLQILKALPQNRASRLTYDDGVLESSSPACLLLSAELRRLSELVELGEGMA